MTSPFKKVIEFAYQSSLEIVDQIEEDEIIIVSNDEKGICNLIIDCEYPILVMEQLIYKVTTPSESMFKRLLQMNRRFIHGAFVLDEENNNVLFRDTLQLENLDYNEFDGSINALSIGLAEFSSELLQLNK